MFSLFRKSKPQREDKPVTATVLPLQEPPHRADGLVEFVATRSFCRGVGVDVMEGTELLLDDKEARDLVALECVEPKYARDRKRLGRGPEKIEWALQR